MPKVHRVESMDAFCVWGVHTPQHMAMPSEHREKFARLSKGEYCCACGKKIARGEKLYQTYVSWGRSIQESRLGPLHTTPCIAKLDVEFWGEGDERGPHLSNYDFTRPTSIGEIVGDMETFTLEETVEYAAYAERNLHMDWKQCVIKENDVIRFIFVEGQEIALPDTWKKGKQ